MLKNKPKTALCQPRQGGSEPMPHTLKHTRHFIILCLLLIPILSGLLLPANLEPPSTVDSTFQESYHKFHESPHQTPQTSYPNFASPESQISTPPVPNGSLASFELGNLLVLYGDYINESGQEPIEAWTTLFCNLGFNTTSRHISNFSQSLEFDLIVITPSVGTSGVSFGVPLVAAEAVVNCGQPVLILGYAHEVLDQLYDFDPIADFIPSIERYLWSPDEAYQIFSHPHLIPLATGRFGIYANHVHYDAYRMSALPSKAEVLGTNYDESGAQLLWFRAYTKNPHIYYWGVDQVANLNLYGQQFCENLIHWLIRPALQQRLGKTLASWQLPAVSNGDYWELQGAGGFGYPLEPSLRFSYFVADMVVKHGLPVNLSNYGPWLLSCYDSDLGCFEDIASPQLQDRCITTAMSVLMADALGILDQFNQTQIREYLSGCQDTVSGGFFTELNSSQATITATCYAIQGLSVLGQLQAIDIQGVSAFISNCQELDPSNSEYGGFYSSPSGGLSASLVYATEALITLSQIATMGVINQSALLDFLAGCEEPSGSAIFDTRYTMDSDEWILGTSNAIQLLTLIGSLELYNLSASRAYILANQFSNGGWGRGDTLHDFHDSPDETWQGARALVLTGGLGNTELPLTQYLTHCNTDWGGATEPVIFGDFLTSVEIVLTLSQIDALELMNLSAYLGFLEHCWSQSRASFVAHQLPSCVGTDTDSPTPDRIALEGGTFGPLYHYAYSKLLSVLELTTDPWVTRATQIREEIEAAQTDALGYLGMIGLHHLYLGRESDVTFRFDTTCWNLLAHQALGGQPTDLNDAAAALSYLTGCLQSNTTHQYFYDLTHVVPIPTLWREAEGYLAETWLGLQAFAYLNPSLSGLDGQKLATYAISYLGENASLITSYYIIEILHLLVESGLELNALTLVDWNSIKPKILSTFTFTGLVLDLSFPLGKWMPHLENLAVQLINRLDLLPQLDVNPILSLTEIVYPSGVVCLGSNVTFSATVIETRWGQLPNVIQVQAQIFNSTYIDGCISIPPGYYELQSTIPFTSHALGPQNLSLTAFAPGAIPDYTHFIDICTGWGSLTVDTIMSPGPQVPRSIPLNIAIELRLEGASTSYEPLMIGDVFLTVETTSETFSTSYLGENQYLATIPTDTLAPYNHILRINASIPYCAFYTYTTSVAIVVFGTFLTLEKIAPVAPVLLDATTIAIGLWNASGTPLIGYQVLFSIIRPSESLPYQVVTGITDETGVAVCSWIPDLVGQWQINYTFSEQAMFTACQNSAAIHVSRRPLACTITLLSSATVFVGNQSFAQIEVSDKLNGSSLPDLLVSLYEGTVLLASASTNANGIATCQWSASAPVGLREVRFEVTATATHEPWSSSPLTYLIRDTTTLLASSNTTQLYAGEMLSLDLQISASASPPPNGTASVFWDGRWQHDVIITQGFGTTLLPIAYTEPAGDHSLVVLFGHIDTPDSYAESSTTFLVKLRETIIPTFTLTIDPLEIDDPQLNPTMEIRVLLSYVNGSQVHGLIANLTVQLHSQDDILFAVYFILTDFTGRGQSTIITPPPGLYTMTVLYKGQRGFAPCSVTSPFLVRLPYNQIGDISSILLLGSLVVMIVGLVVGAFISLRLQQRLNDFLHHIQPDQNVLADSSILFHQSLEPLASNPQPGHTDDLNDD
jgi:prenyltransferase beta subunit